MGRRENYVSSKFRLKKKKKLQELGTKCALRFLAAKAKEGTEWKIFLSLSDKMKHGAH